MNLYKADKESIKKAAGIIKQGGLVAFPTETVYGLGADVFNPVAVAGIFEAKKRPFFDPLISHICRLEDAELLSDNIPDLFYKLAERFWPGPLTMVLPGSPRVPEIVTSGLETVAVRMPSHPVALDLIREAGTPIAAPSANPFGYLSPTSAIHVYKQLGNRVDMILDGGNCHVGVESTIIRLIENRTVLLRPGGIPVEEISEITGPVEISHEKSDLPDAPGQLPFHYSPTTPVKIVNKIGSDILSQNNAGFLFYLKPEDMPSGERYMCLSETGSLREAAANLFSSLHVLDSLGLGVIYVERVSSEGLGCAIMDRLVKASKKGENNYENQ